LTSLRTAIDVVNPELLQLTISGSVRARSVVLIGLVK
jgi:hypothetical protein